jgi:flagellar protein FlgJ
VTTDGLVRTAAEAKLPAAPQPAAGAEIRSTEELRKVARQFESLFMKMLISSMRKTVQKQPLFHGGRAEETFADLLDQHHAEAMAKKGRGLGIGDMIVKRYAAHVRAMEEQKGGQLDTAAPAGVVTR